MVTTQVAKQVASDCSGSTAPKILFGGIKAEATTKVFKELGLNVAFFS
jgi:hypothetical protein